LFDKVLIPETLSLVEKSRKAPIINNENLLLKFSNLTKKDVQNKNFSAFIKLTDLEEEVGRPMKETESIHDLFDETQSKKNNKKIQDKQYRKRKKSKSKLKVITATNLSKKRQALKDIFGSSTDSDDSVNNKEKIKLYNKKMKFVENSKNKFLGKSFDTVKSSRSIFNRSINSTKLNKSENPETIDEKWEKVYEGKPNLVLNQLKEIRKKQFKTASLNSQASTSTITQNLKQKDVIKTNLSNTGVKNSAFVSRCKENDSYKKLRDGKEKDKCVIENSFDKQSNCKLSMQTKSSCLKKDTMAVGIQKHLESKNKNKSTISSTNTFNKRPLLDHREGFQPLLKPKVRIAKKPTLDMLSRPCPLKIKTSSQISMVNRTEYINKFFNTLLERKFKRATAIDIAQKEEAEIAQISISLIGYKFKMGSLKTNRKFSNSKSTTSSNKQGKLQSNKSSESNIRLTGTSSTVQSQRSLSSGISTSKKKKRIAHSSVYDPVVPNSTVAANSFDSSQINFQKNHSSMIHHLHQEFISSKDFHQKLRKYILTEEQLNSNGYPRPLENFQQKLRDDGVKEFYCCFKDGKKREVIPSNLKVCIRCQKNFFVSSSKENDQECYYHPKKPFNKRLGAGRSREFVYDCCGASVGESEGCNVADSHVHDENKNKLNGYVKTIDLRKKERVYGLDCEMIYTTQGFELARVSLVKHTGEIRYDTCVQPKGRVLDYNTKFSGITVDSLRNCKKTFNQVQNDLVNLISSKSILIGHSLESDLIALRLLHSNVVDTSVVFPHKNPDYKKALRTITQMYLGVTIQSQEREGHDPTEDAVACIKIMRKKVEEK